LGEISKFWRSERMSMLSHHSRALSLLENRALF
jgi:hypothetical protein